MTTKRPAFTLVEILVASLISGFMLLSLTSIYSTANRHVFQSHRANRIKGDMSLAMRAIRQAAGQATSVRLPTAGNTDNRLFLASNVDHVTGCYPLHAAHTPAWYYFCVSGSDLYYYTGSYAGNAACACPSSACGFSAPAFACGAAGNNRMLLAKFINTSAPVFSRSLILGDVVSNASFLVRLRSQWSPTGGLAETQRPIDYTIQSLFTVAAAGN